jgi:hypothetical protein
VDIANFVAPFYRASPGNQLAVVRVVNLESQAAQAAASAAANGTTAPPATDSVQVAVRPSETSTQLGLLPGNTVAYSLCGLGTKCAIAVGKPSTNRLLLLRREALELALYTFKYMPQTNNVVAILPPGHTEQTSTSTKRPPAANSSASTPVAIAVLFVRQEVQPLLNRPLDHTLPELVRPTVAQMPKAQEAQLVSELTARSLFSEKLEATQDGSDLIVLDPLPPQ